MRPNYDGSSAQLSPEELRTRLEEERAARLSAEERLESQGRALRRIQSQLRDLAVEARGVGRARLDFLDILQHELRTPLHGILGTTSVLLADEPADAQREMLELIEHFGARLTNVVQDLLEFSRLEAGALEISYTPMQPAGVARVAVESVRSEAEEKELELRLTLDPALPDSVEADERHLAQLLHLLLGNALKFTEEGKVELSVSWDEDSSTLGFVVADTGIGIPRDRVEAIFEPYEQADPTMTRRFGGAGLGLAIARMLVEILEGSIQVFSREGEGSRFEVRLPVEVFADESNEEGLPQEAPVEFE